MNQGGSYRRNAKGERERVAGTEDHPHGNRPRDAKGTPLDAAAATRERPPKETLTPKAQPSKTETDDA